MTDNLVVAAVDSRGALRVGSYAIACAVGSVAVGVLGVGRKKTGSMSGAGLELMARQVSK